MNIPPNTPQQTGTAIKNDFSFLSQSIDIQNTNSIPDVLNLLFMAALSVGSILAVLRIVYAGYLYTSSDIWGTKSKAKEVLKQAIFGLIMLLSVWLILNTINPDILNLDILRSVNGERSVNTPGFAAPGQRN